MNTERQPTPMEELQHRFEKAIERLSNDVGRLMTDIQAHPRYNEKMERARHLLATLEVAAESARDLLKAQDRTAIVEHLIRTIETIAHDAHELANENQLHPASSIARAAATSGT